MLQVRFIEIFRAFNGPDLRCCHTFGLQNKSEDLATAETQKSVGESRSMEGRAARTFCLSQ